jgi:hypothetical protein
MRRVHPATLVGAVLAGGAALLGLGPVAVAVVMLRCCDDAAGPTAGAWLVLGTVLAALVALAALLGALLARLARRALARLSRRGA